jgi:rSAM/selenodomain-associated transferase 2
MMDARRISVIIPAFNEAQEIENCLRALQAMRERGHEVILVDGGSCDETVDLATPLADRVLTSPPGRARQMNVGAACATGDIFWFLHADTQAPEDADGFILEGLDHAAPGWGYFCVRLTGRALPLRLVERLMSLRSRWSGIATGDQGLFVTRRLFERVGGFPKIPLMEDVGLSKRLKGERRPHCLRERLITSSRRWEARGIVRTILLMWRLRAAYALGASPHRLAMRYD